MKTSIKCAYAFCLALLVSITAFSQKKNITGHYIKLNGEKVDGVIQNYTQWYRNPDKVYFIPAGSSNQIELTPSNTLQFTIDNYDTYLAYTGKRLTNPIDDAEVINKGNFIVAEDEYADISTFLRLVLKTEKVELYVYTDKIRTNFFFKKPNQPLEELRFKKSYKDTKIAPMYSYRQQISVAFSDEIANNKLFEDIARLEYTEEKLERFFFKLSPKEKQKKRQKNPAAGWVITGGIAVSSMKVEGVQSVSLTRFDYKTSISPLVTIGYHLPINRNFNRFFFYPHLKFYNYKNTGERVGDNYKHTATYKTSLVTSPTLNGGLHVYNTEKLRLFASAGAGFLLLTNNKQITEDKQLSNNQTYIKSETELKNTDFNFNFSTGFLLNNRIIGWASYNTPASIGNFIMYNPMHSSIQLGVGLKLK